MLPLGISSEIYVINFKKALMFFRSREALSIVQWGVNTALEKLVD